MARIDLAAARRVSRTVVRPVQPSNSSLYASQANSETQLSLVASPPPPGLAGYNIAPLSTTAGVGLSADDLQSIGGRGNISDVTPTNVGSIGVHDIAFISCDPSSDTGFIDPATLISKAVDQQPFMILLYSLDSLWCNLTDSTGDYPSTKVYSMVSSSDSNSLHTILQNQSPIAAILGLNYTSSGPTNATTSTAPGGPAPTTAVAMSILYAITGIITVLFLIVIGTGAVRVHRHPERYGPRAAGPTGRPRQSRAKGLARAMLETLPIVKFGDPEPVKPGERDIELEDGSSSVHPPVELNETATVAHGAVPSNPPAAAEEAPGHKPTAQPEMSENTPETSANPVELGCSICTEDFTTGEDLRVLPCNHKFHPACVDPWLLNVSGTCPLCRHDLRPAQNAEGAEVREGAAEGTELPPPLADNEGVENGTAPADGHETSSQNSHHHRLGRLLDRTRLRNAPREERIAALRQLREQSQNNPEPADPEQPARHAGLTSRLRDAFRIRTRTQSAAQE